MTLDFDVERELARDDAKEVTDEFLKSDMRYFVEKVLEGLNAPIVIPEKRVMDLFERAITSRTVAFSGPVPEGVHYGNPTVEFLRSLPDDYYGRRVKLTRGDGVKVPFSLAKVGDRIYIRQHI